MVNLPTKWKDPSDKKIYDLQAVDLPIAASIIAHHDLGLCMILTQSEEVWRSSNPIPEKAPNTRVAIEMKGGYLQIQNKRLLKMIMNSNAWNDLVGPDPEDPTGFWQMVGVVTSRQIEVVVIEDVKAATFDKLEFKKLKKSEEKPAPLHLIDRSKIASQLDRVPSGVQG